MLVHQTWHPHFLVDKRKYDDFCEIQAATATLLEQDPEDPPEPLQNQPSQIPEEGKNVATIAR